MAADPSRAAQLIFEDTSTDYNQVTTANELHDIDNAYGSSVSHGKARRNDRERFSEDEDEMEEDDEMAWEPPATTAQAKARRQSGELEYQPQTPRRRPEPTLNEQQRKALWWKNAAISMIYILAWYSFSTLISVYNKWMFSADHFDFPYPLFVTSFHMLVQWLLSALTLSVFKNLRSPHNPKPQDYFSKVLPCGVATGLDIGLSNLSLRTITLSFYTMCKSSGLIFVLGFAFLFRLEVPSWRLVGIIFIITAGVVLMVSSETQFDLGGMIAVLTASALGGLRWSLVQILLEKESMGMTNPVATLFWLAPIMGITLATCSLIFDGWGNVFSNATFFGSVSATISTIGAIIFPGVIAFLMNLTEFGLIQRTSVVTLSVAGIFKEVAVIFLSMFIFHDQLTPINVTGLAITIFGIGLYNYLKYSQYVNKPKEVDGEFIPLQGIDGEGETDPMLDSPRAQRATRVLGTTNQSALSLDDSGNYASNYSSPHHFLGDDEDDSPSRSARSSVEVPTYDDATHLRRATSSGKARQHEEARVEGLESLLEGDAELVELDKKEKEVESVLNEGIDKHQTAEDWDLLSDPDLEGGKKV